MNKVVCVKNFKDGEFKSLLYKIINLKKFKKIW